MAERIHSVAGLTALIRDSLEGRFFDLWVEGEISNLRQPGSGHYYFTLKDAYAQISCVFFKGAAARCGLRIADGQQIQVYGNLSVYEARGQYQLVVQTVQRKGDGALQAKFEALKRKLEAEGLFDPARKKAIPSFPERIGVVTSPTGAAIRDILNVLSRRAPWLRVIIYPVRVQGDGAAEEIAEGVRCFDTSKEEMRPDLIIVARGGGSVEDLWAFNEEVLARAITACSVPVMTGVGHEIDFTIADFVADRREPTPSAAAENAVPDGGTLRRVLGSLGDNLDSRSTRTLDAIQGGLQALHRELQAREPGRRIQSWAQTLDFLGERLDYLIDGGYEARRTRWSVLGRALETIRPEKVVDHNADDLQSWIERLDHAAQRRLQDKTQRLDASGAMMRSLSPTAVLKRGFSLSTDANGQILLSAEQLRPGDRMITRLADGQVTSRIE